MEKRRVILYGKSIILGTAGVSLQRCPDIEIISLAPPLPAAKALGELAPDVILFDLEAAHPEAALTLLQTRPRLLLIGIDPATDEMLLWSGEHSRALSMQDLIEAIGATNSPAQPADSAPAFARRLGTLAARWNASPFTNKQKQALIIALILLAVLLPLAFARWQPNTPLSGAALGENPLSINLLLAFAAGILIGGLALALWMKLQRKK